MATTTDKKDPSIVDNASNEDLQPTTTNPSRDLGGEHNVDGRNDWEGMIPAQTFPNSALGGSRSLPANIYDIFRPIDSNDNQRPGVEWVYPENYVGPRHELGIDSEIVSRISENDVTDQNIRLDESSEENSVNYIVNPNDVQVTLDVEGIVVPRRLCYLKICGFVVCDDSFACLLNPKIFSFLLGSLFIASFAAVVILSSKEFSGPEPQNEYESMDGEPYELVVDSRIARINQTLFKVSGDVIFQGNSSQNKALNWILYEDDFRLLHNSSNLLQRYSIMVFFFGLSGENWRRNDGFGTGMHECDWFGISCSTINGLRYITHLKITGNGLNGQIPNEITLLSRLMKLNLNSNAITGNIPHDIGELKKLQRLYLGYNRLTGSIPEGILNCEDIEWIMLRNNFICCSIPKFSSEQWALTRIDLQSNKISGTIPTSLGSLNALQVLILGSNHLMRSIPPELGNATALEELILNDNHLKGEIPSSIEKLNDLKKLNLSGNFLSGIIPATMYQLSNLIELKLNSNFFTGSIPSQLNFLSRVEDIHLYENNIIGTIPENLGHLLQLEELKLHSLMLNGTVPQSICDRKLKSLTVDCAGENPDVSCSCCTECF